MKNEKKSWNLSINKIIDNLYKNKATRSGIYILKDEDIEKCTQKILSLLDSRHYLCKNKIDIEWIAEFGWKCSVQYCCLSENGETLGTSSLNGGVIKVYDNENKYIESKTGDIFIDNKACQNKNQERFTLEHELGHSIMHSRLNLNPSIQFFTDSKSTLLKKKLVTPSDWLEHQANIFAASILMPRQIITKLFNKYRAFHDNDDFIIDDISKEMDVSFTSVKIRLKQLKLIDVD